MKSPGTVHIKQMFRASNSHDTATTAVPVHIDDTVFKGKLPLFIRSLCTQLPAPGTFTVEDLDWTLVGTGTQMGLAAAFMHNRLNDFRAGESQRGRCRVDISNVMPPTEGVPMSVRGVCVFAAPHSAVEKRRQAEPATAPPLPCKEGVKARYGKHQTGTSCKKNCAYYFFAKAYAKCPGVVIIKFPCSQGDTPQTCASMRHCTPAGSPAHTDVDAQIFLRQWSERATDLIIEQLKQQKKPSLIVQEVRTSIMKWLNIPEGSSALEIQHRVANSPYAKDFNVTSARIRYLRQQYVDVKWMEPQPEPTSAAIDDPPATGVPSSAAETHHEAPCLQAAAAISSGAVAVASSSPLGCFGQAVPTAPAIPAAAATAAKVSAPSIDSAAAILPAAAGTPAIAALDLAPTPPVAAAIAVAHEFGLLPRREEPSTSALPEAPADSGVASEAAVQAQEEVEMLAKLAFWQIQRSPSHVQPAQIQQVRSAVMAACWEVMSLQKQANDETVQESVREASTAGVACSVDALEAVSRMNSTQHTHKAVPHDSEPPAAAAPPRQHVQEDCTFKSQCDDNGPHSNAFHEMDLVSDGSRGHQAVHGAELCITQGRDGRDSERGLVPPQKRGRTDPGLRWPESLAAQPSAPAQQAVLAQQADVELAAQQALQPLLSVWLQQQSQLQEDSAEAQHREQQELQQDCLRLLQQLGQQQVVEQQQVAPQLESQHEVLRLIALGLHGAASDR